MEIFNPITAMIFGIISGIIISIIIIKKHKTDII